LYDADKRFLDFNGVRWIFSGSDLSRVKDIDNGVNANATGAWYDMSTTAEMVEGRVVEQEFISGASNLSKIELLYYRLASSNDTNSTITLDLFDEGLNTTVWSESINISLIKDYVWYPVCFDPLSDSKNRTYILKVMGYGDLGNAPVLYINNIKNNSSVGDLKIDGSDVQGSLCIFTYYDKSDGLTLVNKYNGYYVFENTNAMPRAFMAYNATYAMDDVSILSGLHNSSNDWYSSIIIQGNGENRSYQAGNNIVKIIDYLPEHVRIEANSSTPGYLVLTDTYYPGWNAYVDGNKTDIQRANYAFRSVLLDEGDHIVEFKYEPMSLYIGILVTVSSAIILIAFWVWRRQHDKIERK
jgi:hypothetical protein